MRSAYAFRQETGTSLAALLREGRAMKQGNDLTWSQVVMAANAPVMTKAALVEGRTDVGVLPTGQVVGVLDALTSGGRHRRRHHGRSRRNPPDVGSDLSRTGVPSGTSGPQLVLDCPPD